MWYSSDFQYIFRSSRSTVDLLTIASASIARATQAVAIDTSMAINRVSHAVPLHKLKSYGILGRVLDLILSFSIIDSGSGWEVIPIISS